MLIHKLNPDTDTTDTEVKERPLFIVKGELVTLDTSLASPDETALSNVESSWSTWFHPYLEQATTAKIGENSGHYKRIDTASPGVLLRYILTRPMAVKDVTIVGRQGYVVRSSTLYVQLETTYGAAVKSDAGAGTHPMMVGDVVALSLQFDAELDSPHVQFLYFNVTVVA